MKNQKGITLISLVITIIILIILAGVSINLMIRQDGIITKVKNAKEKYEISAILEKLELKKLKLKTEGIKLNIDNYLTNLEDDNNINFTLDERVDEDNAYIIVDGKYKFLLEYKENNNLIITYEGTATGLKSNFVTYNIDTQVSYQEKVKEKQTCLSPTTFTPSKSGYTFVGWREDNTADETVLTSKIMGDSQVNLYAVFSKEVTITYNGNENTEGATEISKGTAYYNNGNIKNANIILAQNGFSKTDNTFVKWAEGSIDGTQYSEGDVYSVGTDKTLYAIWQSNILTIISDGELLNPEYIISNIGEVKSAHKLTTDVEATTNTTSLYFGKSCQGTDDGNHDSCTQNSWVDITLTLDDSLVGKQCTMEAAYKYNARFLGVTNAYIKNGDTKVITFSGIKTDTKSQTFTLESNTIQLYLKFPCANSAWVPSGYIGIKSMVVE